MNNMNQELKIATNEAKELAQKAIELSEKLSSVSMETQMHQASQIDPLIFAITIFILSCFVGYYVVWKVTPALHTPLMSITNAISGIIIIGALIASGSGGFSFSLILGFFAVFLASINIFGGFIVTQRMLEMFRKK